ncbi:type II secretion system F family protein [Pseudotabrizicola alkalilacus]|uniref:Type II secretion system protein GspF domain-containing protein n=1 Tax=Pseudotabrizicola alkalilacus TaxID=2305252 RepID=A0A411YYN4_9RHOB|nr:type II secretion system F family protein [Pseudotabrizicola alkalilacus]RGP35902.1 hypothetical protein D1012_17730 [Pseudotabrizicola alkalilacus]
MPRFRYAAYAADGSAENGALQAASEAEALKRLAALGLTVTDLGPDRAGQGAAGGRIIPLAAQADLAEQLSVLFAARLPAPKVAEIVATSNRTPAIRRHFQRVGQLMADGAGFADAMEQASDRLSPLFSVMASIGQATARPGQQMPQLATALRRQQKMLGQLSGALVYPAILLVGGVGIILVMSLFLAPRLAVIFTSVNQPLPSAIAGFVALGEGVVVWGLPVAIGVAAALLWVIRALRRPGSDLRRMMRRFPGFGPVLRDVSLARIVRAVQLMQEAGMPLAVSLSAAASAFSTDPEAALFARAAEALEGGARASSVLSQDPSLPAMLREMIRIGEETNTLPQVLSVAATALEDEVERRLQRMMALATPLLTLLIGAVIALIVGSVMSAILSVNDLAL